MLNYNFIKIVILFIYFVYDTIVKKTYLLKQAFELKIFITVQARYKLVAMLVICKNSYRNIKISYNRIGLATKNKIIGGFIMKDINSLSHSKWRCKYHIVFAPK